MGASRSFHGRSPRIARTPYDRRRERMAADARIRMGNVRDRSRADDTTPRMSLEQQR